MPIFLPLQEKIGSMIPKTINELSIPFVKEIFAGGSINDELLFVDEFARLPFPNMPRRATCIIMALCLRGKGQYCLDTTAHTVLPNDLLIINEGQMIDNYALSPDFSGIAIMMSKNFFHEIIKGIHELSALFLFSRTHPVFNLSDGDISNISTYLKMLKIKLNDTENHFRTDVVRSLIQTMIYDVSNVIYQMQTTNRLQTRAEAIFAQFLKLVEENFRSKRKVGWYADQLCITPKYLSETVKHVSRRTPNEWIDNYVILEIRVLLKNSAMSIKEIAECLHFPNQSFLGKYFKEHVGVSPSQYRKA